MSEEVENYTVRPGTKNVGPKYELLFIINVALKLSLDQQIHNFKILTNCDSWGDFDDAVFEIDHQDSKRIICVQLKHTGTSLTYENLTKPKGDYSLDKYYKSYKEIRKRYDFRDTEIYFVLFTTGCYSKTVEDFHWQGRYVKKGSLTKPEILPVESQCIQFFIGDLCTKSDFLSRFFIYTNQNNFSKLETENRNLVYNLFGYDISDDLFSFMDGWSKGHYGSHYKMTRNEFVSQASEFLLAPNLVTPVFKKEKLSFVELWDEATQSVEVTVVGDEHISKIWHCIFEKMNLGQNWCQDDWMKSRHSLENITDLPKRFSLSKARDYKISLRNLYFVFWKTGRVPLFLKNSETLPEIFRFALTTSPKKHFIVVSDETTRFQDFSKFENLADLYESPVFQIISKSVFVAIQNRFEMSLGEMANSDDLFLARITPDVFLQLLENNVVGVVDPQQPDIYIKRKISAFHVDFRVLKYVRDSIVFILCDLNNHYDYIKNNFPKRIVEFVGFGTDVSLEEKNIVVADYGVSMSLVKSFLKTANHKHYIFLLTQKVGVFTLKWLQGTASIIFLKEFVSDSGNLEEEDDFFSNMQNPISVISAPPGMGKSTLINQIYKTCSQNFWILKIGLVEHSRCFDSKLNSQPLDYFCTNFYGNNKLTKTVVNSFARSQRVLILLDGFDEIAPKFIQDVFNLVRYFQNQNFIQCIITRPSTVHILEKKFNILSHSICPFDFDEKIEFVEKYSENVSPNLQKRFRDILLSFLTTLDQQFFDNPLHMSMLCEIVKNDLETSMYFGIVNNSHLYKKFVDVKFSLFEQKYLKGCDPVVYQDLVEKIRDVNILNHQICSMIAVFGHEATRHFVKKSHLNFLRKIREGDEKIGIITQVDLDNVPIFVHQTYAEYFAATWLAENWKDNKRAKKCLQLVFFSKLYSTVRLFFDRIVSSDLDFFQAVLDQDFEKIQNCQNFQVLDSLGRNALHLACSWKPKNDTRYFKYLLEKIDPLSGFDQFSNLTPIGYADESKNVVAIDAILQNYFFDLSKLKICSNIKWLLHMCIKKKCITLLSKFVEYLNSLDNWVITGDYDNLLFTAIETNNLEIVKILLSINNFRRHIKNTEMHGNAALQLAIILGNETIAKKLVYFDSLSRQNSRLSAYDIAVEEASEDIKEIMVIADD